MHTHPPPAHHTHAGAPAHPHTHTHMVRIGTHFVSHAIPVEPSTDHENNNDGLKSYLSRSKD